MNEKLEKMIAHYGVQGMKWGIRKGRVPKSGPSDDAKGAHRALVKSKRSGVIALSNNELKSLNNRLQLETTYRQLTAKPTLLEKGTKLVGSIVTVGKSYDEVAKLTGQKQVKEIVAAKKAAAIAKKAK